MENKSVLITGGTGFIGRNIYEVLNKKHQVVAPTRNEMNLLIYSDLDTYFSNHSVDYVINCAGVGAYRINNNSVNFENNLRIFYNILKICTENEIKLFHMGSGAEYDKIKSLKRVKEVEFNTSIPKDPYGFSKYIISKQIEDIKNVVCLRLFGVYGKYEDYAYRFISNAIVRNCFKLPIIIRKNVVFDYLYVNDLTKIIIKFITKFPENKFLNITPDESIDLITIANIINEISDFKSDIRILSPGFAHEYTGSNESLMKEINEFKFTPYYQGINILYNYYKLNLDVVNINRVCVDPLTK